MHAFHLALIASLGFATSWHAAPVPPLDTTQAAATTAVTSTLTVTLPQDGAELSIDGTPVPGSGSSRTITSTAAPRRTAQQLTLTATWQPNTYTTMTRSRVVRFRAGEPITVDLSAEDPADRVRVQYVPTPDDIVAEMVKLAGITPSDVVFEPGCGDARITIAAVKAGARRGVGIDIDPERVEESRANVKAARLEDRVEIRLGDALDIKDLSDASVVMLYMGDHFNLLIRPTLWKHLKVGARVVSHRFLMGDWTPDKTVAVGGVEGFDYQLHIWTITDEVKRRAAER